LPEKRGIARGKRINTRVEPVGCSCSGPLADERERETLERAREACADRTRADDDQLIPPRVYNRASISVAN
jgi:hypothetical protein